jgi:Fic family protein
VKKPQPPPNIDLAAFLADLGRTDVSQRLLTAFSVPDRYLPWDELRNRQPPVGLTKEEWWAALKVRRLVMRRDLPLLDKDGNPFSYALPDDALRGIELVDKQASGRISAPAPVLPEAPTRERYVINSLIEEAITSSQLEGAATPRHVAKEMLRTGRKPRTRDERMILNNYLGMLRVREFRHERLTPAMVIDFHRIITEGTLDDEGDCGRLQLPGEERVVVVGGYDGEVMHAPPDATQLPQRLDRLCQFANGDLDTAYVPPVVRAILLHFMLAYDHPFVDGNGRTARLLFYWSMLSQDYWLAEFLPISRLLKKAPAQYARSFLHSEQDGGDLTYFVLYQLRIAQRAINDLHQYLDRKVAETQQLREALKAVSRRFNARQLALLENAIKNPGARYTVASHGMSHGIVAETARSDLRDLEAHGFLDRLTAGRGFAWTPADDLERRLRTERGSSSSENREIRGLPRAIRGLASG